MMKTIPIEVIEKTWSEIVNATEAKAQTMARRMQEEQPFLMVYLLARDEEIFDDSERGRLLELGSLVWRVMSSGHRRLRKVTDTDIEEAENANIRLLTSAGDGSEADFENLMSSLMTSYNQMPLLGALLELIMAGYEESPELLPEEMGMTWIYLKTVIDCLDQ